MPKYDEFVQWLESKDCHVEVTQEDDGSGYIVAVVTMPDQREFELTVHDAD